MSFQNKRHEHFNNLKGFSKKVLFKLWSFMPVFLKSPAMRPRSLTRDDDTRLRAYTSLPLQVEPAVGNGHGK